MPTVEWHIPFSIVTPRGTMTFNQFPGLMLDQTRCKASRRIRAVTEDIPMGDGEIFHRRFTAGYEMRFVGEAWRDENVMFCPGQEDIVDLRDQLYGHLWSLLRPPDDENRVIWTPTGKPDRLLNGIRLLSIEDPTIDDEGKVTFDFTVDSPFPYAISQAENVQTISGTSFVANAGNVEHYPVFKVHGGTGAFSIQNNGTGDVYLYDSSRPGAVGIGGGSYGEIDMFRGGIIYLNGDGANLKAGIDVEFSNLIYIRPGGDSISVFGASADILAHDAFA